MNNSCDNYSILKLKYLENFLYIVAIIPHFCCKCCTNIKGGNYSKEEIIHGNIVSDVCANGLRTPREEIAFTARPKIPSQSQIFRCSRSIFCLPHLDLCLHWVSVVRVCAARTSPKKFDDPFRS